MNVPTLDLRRVLFRILRMLEPTPTVKGVTGFLRIRVSRADA